MDDKSKELAEIALSPYAFLKYVRIRQPGTLSLKYELWPHLIEFYRLLELIKLLILIKSKQIGVSWALAVKALRSIYTIPGANVLMLSSGQGQSQALLEKVKVIYENLPGWMKYVDLPDKDGKFHEPLILEPNSMSQFGFYKQMGSLITALPSTEIAGIGHTSNLVIHDEADFHEFFEMNLGHTLATVADKPDRQAVIVSTVDKPKPDSYFKKVYREAPGNGFYPKFFGYDVRPDRDENWLEEQKRILSPWIVEGNYPKTVEEALSPLSASSCFQKEALDRLWAEALQPEIKKGFIYILYPPRVGTHYVAGIDVGEGIGQDYSCLTIIGKSGLRADVAAVIYTNTLGTDAFAFEASELCKDYHNPLLNVDNIGIGRAVIDKLKELAYPNLYYPTDKEGNRKEKAGWSLTQPNKRELVTKLVESINNGSLVTGFKPQIKELMEYQYVNGYPEPTGKTHGDTVISLMLAHEMIKKVGVSQKASLYVGGRKIW